MDYAKFDIEAWLDDNDIHYDTHGKNVSDGWIGMACPFCDDQSNHLGINLDSKAYSCWKCGSKGNIVRLIFAIKNGKVRLADLKKYTSGFLKNHKSEGYDFVVPEDIIHSSFKETLMPVHKKWLLSRRFNHYFIQNEYSVLCCGPVGKYPNRLIIPFIHRRKWISYTTRDVTGGAEIKYIHYPTIPVKNFLYNEWRAQDAIIVVEGVTDVWRLGRGSVALMGKNYTEKQIQRLLKYKRIFILLDSDATATAEKLERQLNVFNKDVQVLELTEGDPGDLSDFDVMALRKAIFGKIY